jgi:hypothetical protein
VSIRHGHSPKDYHRSCSKAFRYPCQMLLRNGGITPV